MREPQQQQQQTLHDPEATLVVSGEETTLVAPRFDDEETLVARPVVPFEDGEHAPAPDSPVALPAHDYRSPYAPRRPRMLVLALVSVLVGGVLGGAGLYIYQRQSQDPAVSPVATTQSDAPADAAQAPAAPAAEAQTAPPPETQAAQIESPAAAAPDAEEPATPAPDAEVPTTAPAREPANVPAAERREAPAEDDRNGTPKRGKKGSRDEETVRRPVPRPDEGNVARDDAPEARQVDTIFYRQRRAERRAERRAARRARRDTSDSPDRLRRIFEGPPE
ncbi:MAG: hypothetical protein ABW208_11870 [Pyrinomonadaceae bacterium]